MKKIILVGPFPPPIGGVSVHIKRLISILTIENIKFKLYTTGTHNMQFNNIISRKSYTRILIRLLFNFNKTIHFHISSKLLKCFISMYMIFGNKVILTIHGESVINQFLNSNLFVKKLIIFNLNRINKIICVNNTIYSFLKSKGVNPKKIIVLPAYLPDKYHSIDEPLPEQVNKFLIDDSFKIVTNGTIVVRENSDLYGFNLLVNLMIHLIEKKYNVKLLIIILGSENFNDFQKQYLSELRNTVEKNILSTQIMFYENDGISFHPFLTHSDLYIRATNSDGDSLSIREALELNKIVLTSDVVERPIGCFLYKNSNQGNLNSQVEKIINKEITFKKQPREDEGFIESLIGVYKE